MIERSGLRYHIPGIRRSHIRVIDHRNCFVLIFLLFRRTTLAVADRILQVQNCPSENLHTHILHVHLTLIYSLLSSDALKKPWERSNSAERSSLVSRSVSSCGPLWTLGSPRWADGSSKVWCVLCCRVRPVGSSSEADTEFDRMKQVRRCTLSVLLISLADMMSVYQRTNAELFLCRRSWMKSYVNCIKLKMRSSMVRKDFIPPLFKK